MGTLISQAIGGDGAKVSLASSAEGKLELQIDYPIAKLEGPLLAFLNKVTAKVPFVQSRVPAFVTGVFAALGLKGFVADAIPKESAEPSPAEIAPALAASEAPQVDAVAP